ncbi:MAG: trimeric intracellular cation channel family protein [Alkalilacustris sp.]
MQGLIFLDYIGVALFAATGALAASRKQLDIVGFVFLAAVTGVGGGTARDLILDVPVFWVGTQAYLLVIAATAVGVYFTAHLLESRYTWLLWLDAVALAAYGVYGAAKGFAMTGSAVVAVAMGMLTGCFGGILRDVLAGEPTVLMRREIYVTATLTGGLVLMLGALLGLADVLAAALAFVAAFSVRAGGIAFGWSLPVYKARPGRDVG